MTESISLFDRARAWPERVAISDGAGTHTYSDLLDGSERAAACLLDGKTDLDESRIVFMVEPSFDYVRVQWAIWRAGGVAVPLCLTHPSPELEYVLDTTTPIIAIASSGYADLLRPLADARGIRFLLVEEVNQDPVPLPRIVPDRRAMILFTSGTTGRPKGVVTSHANIQAQIISLVEAWEWDQDDRILLTLPLHHIHGIVNVIGCALWSGARCDVLPSFAADQVVERLSAGDLTLYMAVPTIYHRLIAHLEQASIEANSAFRDGVGRLRLMVSGSAALPVSVLERWRELSGHTLLERYGMTEIGMGLSNPYRDMRIPGSVGMPLPAVEVRLVGDDGSEVSGHEPGEIQVRGPTVFFEYWDRLEDTDSAFTSDGWFRTGDTAIVEKGRYRILGRSSIDILKTGGEKVSALEIEDVLLGHEAISEAAVVGIDDPEWGQRVVAVLVASGPVDAEEVREWMKGRLAPHKVPKEFHFTNSLPRNPMGKTVKPEVMRMLGEEV